MEEDILIRIGRLEANVQTVLTGHKTLFDKIDNLHALIMKNQAHVENLNCLYGNGWRHEIEQKITKVCDDADNRLTELESFSWFGQFITDFRNNIFKHGMRIFLFLGIFVVMCFAVSCVGMTFINKQFPMLMKFFIGG